MVINLTDNKDGSFTLTYFDAVVGFISKVKSNVTAERRFRAVSVHGQLHYSTTLRGARKWLMETYH